MNSPPKFQRCIEDFVCSNCGKAVNGDGYTNHCPGCLWSRHVDIHPGDRSSKCGGMMEPLGVSRKNREYVIVHGCSVCGFERVNRMQEGDDFELIIRLASSSFRSG